jgi:polyisoprenoid-binding protein YceI
MKWNIDPTHSHIQFSVRHMGLSTVRGTFGQLSGTFSEQGGNVDGGDAEVDLASINTNMAARDEHLKAPTFLTSPPIQLRGFISSRPTARVMNSQLPET